MNEDGYARWENSVDPDSEFHEGRRTKTLDSLGTAMWRGTPMTAMAALMEAAPHQEVLRSREEVAHVREPIADAIDNLPEHLRFVFERLVIERVSMSECAGMMGVSKTTIHRYKEEAVVQLRTALQDNPEIQELLHD